MCKPGDRTVFPWRYHATQITTPRQARNTLAYVLTFAASVAQRLDELRGLDDLTRYLHERAPPGSSKE